MSSSSTISKAATTSQSPNWRRLLGRWGLSFLGYPLAGGVAFVLVGHVDNTSTALAGGLVTGLVLGAVQAWAMSADQTLARAWVIASALGLMVGLGIGATTVEFGTDLGDLALQGAITGAVLGLAQAAVLLRRVGPLALAWPVYLAAAWATGWAVTTVSGIGVDAQFSVFGSSGALVVTALTAVLPAVLRKPAN